MGDVPSTDAFPLALEPVPCPLCGATRAATLWAGQDVVLGVPGRFPVARCESCGLLHQNPRVRRDQLDRMYPPGYPPHARTPAPARIASLRAPATRYALARWLGYAHLDPGPIGVVGRMRAARRLRRLQHAVPRWRGHGRLLDVGCATGRFLQRMAAVGWRVSGIEADAEAAAIARSVTPDIFVGDPVDAPFAPGSFDVVTAFHVVEHLPDPARALARMVDWLTPDGLAIVEVPNAGGWGAALFGRHWSGLDYPRHLVHFTPRSMAAMVARAGGEVVATRHWSKPRWIVRSLRSWLGERDGIAARLALAGLDSRAGAGVVKLALEIVLKAAGPARRGEVARYVIRRAAPP